ncbi:MAG TPA: xanthine dehydrogenase family protein subunit M [Acidimicrobiia bacterium]|jgi:carbon-monoxide dehydrogenase medium subunit|nr:xanthine dehydrogenase family protein subunit M [Acidimicrobiia bacterium]
MALPAFDLLRPETVPEATELLTDLGDDAVFYMGGTELLLVMKYGFAEPRYLVDGKRLADLRTLEMRGTTLRIGAGVTHREIEDSDLVREVLPALADLERRIANIRVRNAGTLGGNLCFGEPHSDPATLLIALDATVELVSASGVRSVPLDDFLVGALQTDLHPGEIMTAIDIPVPSSETRVAFERIKFRERPVVNVGIAHGRDTSRLVVGAISARAQRIPEAESMLAAGGQATEVAAAVSNAVDPTPDVEGSVEYKRHLAGVVTRRALASVGI